LCWQNIINLDGIVFEMSSNRIGSGDKLKFDSLQMAPKARSYFHLEARPVKDIRNKRKESSNLAFSFAWEPTTEKVFIALSLSQWTPTETIEENYD
jgi:hypothetical protein